MNDMQDVLEIERIGLSELRTLQELSRRTFYDAFAWSTSPEDMQAYLDKAFSEEQLGSELQNPDSRFYFARLQGKPVGYLKLNFGQAQTEKLEGYGLEIERIYILKECQGRKIGQRLIARAIGVAEELKMQHVWLGVWEKNSGAIALYQRQGFVQAGSHPFIMGKEQQTDLILKRTIGA
jgi:ribosomal protein S18 acetylase RimI-like enzyme